MLNRYCREHLICYAFCGTDITVGAQCATFTCGCCPGSLYTNCQNRPSGKEFNTTAFVNLHIYNVYVNFISWRNLNIVYTKLFPHVRDLDGIVPLPFTQINARRISTTRIYFAFFRGRNLLCWYMFIINATRSLDSDPSECSALSASRDVSVTKSITNQVFATVAI
jgi:hypothetical protein